MEKKRNWKAISTIALVLLAIVYILPTFIGPNIMPSWWPFDKRLSYGLDLQGGLELRYTVDHKTAIGDNTWKVAGLFRDRIIAEHLGKTDDPDAITSEEYKKYRGMVTMARVDFSTVQLMFSDEITSIINKIDNDFVENIDPRFMLADTSSSTLSLQMKYAEVDLRKKEIMSQTMDTIRKRVDAFGLVEPDVRRAGDSDIDVQLPGVDKSKMNLVRAMIGKPAQLTFRLLDIANQDETVANPLDSLSDADIALFKADNPGMAITLEFRNWVEDDNAKRSSTQKHLWAQKKSELVRFFRFVGEQRRAIDPATGKAKQSTLIDDDHMIGFEELTATNVASMKQTSKGWRTHYVIRNMRVPTESGGERPITISGDRLTRAQVSYEQNGQPYASLEFDSEGARDFGDLTTQNVGRFLAIMLDDEVRSAPVIREAITGGRAQITLGSGGGTQQVREAQALVTVLNSGAYKAQVYKVHDHHVGPSLGAQSIQSGIQALIAGGIGVVLFMMFYYRTSGVIAVVALSLNIIFIVAVLVGMNAALTLPGIAGIVLTIGMAVDANVIIFERIREELRAGRAVRAAIDTGYSKAFWTIFDANVTTALAGAILWKMATGPIHGFAVTLVWGIVSSMFTAIVVTRMLFNRMIQKRNVESLSI
jgi:protein-export membrane protein SecD